MSVERMILPKGCMGVHPADVRGPCAAGIDVKPGRLDVVIGDVKMSPETGVPIPRLQFVGKVTSIEQALWVCRQYSVRFGCIDTRPDTGDAKRFQSQAAQYAIKVWRAQYLTSPGVVEVTENRVEQLLTLERTMTLDNVLHAFNTGQILIPQNYLELTSGAFAREMGNATRIPTKWMGKEAIVWEKTGDDDTLHATNLLLVAIQRGGLTFTGGSETMGAERGIVASGARAVTAIDTGVNRPDGEVDLTIDWAAIEEAEDAAGDSWEA